MNFSRIVLALAAFALVSCASPRPVYIITDVIPAGSRIEYFAQIYDETWQPTMKMNAISQPMHVRVAQKWALSAAQQRLGSHWKDYRIRVTPPDGPVIIWQRRSTINL